MMDNNDLIKHEVKQRYAGVALSGDCGCGSGCCGDGEVIPLVDYGDLTLELVDGADLGLGCGIPTQNLILRPGDTVLDLGSGAGVDVFLAARAVGPQGSVIGVDMTPEMIARAWSNAIKGGYTNVEFRLGDIENLPIEENSVDVVLSNCVINLAPNKAQVYAEIYRVLKPGGKISISDMVSYGPVPENIRQDMALWAGCIAGAMDHEAYLEVIRQSGFNNVQVKQSVAYDALKGDDYGLASITVEAVKE
jgi:arsenite methyltransferase